MQKVVDFLERYCQWVAVGIGGLFFLFALYQYLPVVSTPVKTTIGGDVVTPGEIDSRIVANVAEPLETAMNDSSPVTIRVPNYIEQVTNMATSAPKLPPLSLSMTTVRKVELPDLPWDATNTPEMAVQNAIVLARPPAAVLDPEPTSGFAQVNPVAAPAGGAAPAPAAGNADDVTWVRVPFRISITQIDRELRQANVPPALAKTNFVRVELIRQRQMPDGNWGPEEVIAPINASELQSIPQANNVASLLTYNDWAVQHQQEIVQPRFYQLLAGDNPMAAPMPALPGEGGQMDANAPFNPEAYLPAGSNLEGLTPEQRKQVMEARRARAKQDADARRGASQGRQQGAGGERGQGGGYPGAPGGGRGGPPFSSPAGQPSRESSPTLFGGGGGGGNPGGGAPQPPRPPLPGGGGMPPMGPSDGYPGMDGMPQGGGGEIMMPPIPNGQFVPIAGTPDVFGHAFDLTAKAGATYRYRIRYSIMNPLFNANVAGVGPDVAGVYALVGEDTGKWTTSVTVKSNIHVYLQAVPTPGASLVRFTIFRWENGKWNRANQAFSLGDSIGKVDGDVDYRSPYTLVDVRKDSTSDRAYVLIMSDEGTVQRREFDVDESSEQYKTLKQAVEGPPVPPAGQQGGFPGGGYPGGYPGGGYPGMGGGYPGAGGPQP